MGTITKVVVYSLGIFFFCTTPVFAQHTQHNSSTATSQQQQIETVNLLSLPEVLPEWKKARVIYLGETHSSQKDHEAQLAIIEALTRENSKIAIAMEMFQRPAQDILDQYLAGKITEAELVKQSEYEQRWGLPWEYYAPLVRFAKTNQLPVLALNTPTEVTRKVARRGLESLTSAEQEHIPPLSEIRTDNADYRNLIQGFYQQHHHAGHSNSLNFDNFFAAQVLWDETMAEKIALFAQANPDYQVVVIAGQGHIIYDYGIPSRVARRFNHQLEQISVLLGAQPEKLAGENAIADYLWEHPF